MVEVVATFLKKYILVIVFVFVLSLLGGIAAYIRKKKSGEIKKFSFFEFIGDMFIAAFVGIVTYLICKGVGLNELLSAGIVGIAAHEGTRAIVLIEWLIPKAALKYFKINK